LTLVQRLALVTGATVCVGGGRRRRQRPRDAPIGWASGSRRSPSPTAPYSRSAIEPGASMVQTETAETDETRNCGEMNRELPSARKGKSYSAEPSGGAGRPPDLCDSYNREATDPNRRTYRRASPRETKSGAPIVVANLVPTHDRGPGPPGDRSTWLLLSPRRRRRLTGDAGACFGEGANSKYCRARSRRIARAPPRATRITNAEVGRDRLRRPGTIAH
jgi:hypothetical protein